MFEIFKFLPPSISPPTPEASPSLSAEDISVIIFLVAIFLFIYSVILIAIVKKVIYSRIEKENKDKLIKELTIKLSEKQRNRDHNRDHNGYK